MVLDFNLIYVKIPLEDGYGNTGVMLIRLLDISRKAFATDSRGAAKLTLYYADGTQFVFEGDNARNADQIIDKHLGELIIN